MGSDEGHESDGEVLVVGETPQKRGRARAPSSTRGAAENKARPGRCLSRHRCILASRYLELACPMRPFGPGSWLPRPFARGLVGQWWVDRKGYIPLFFKCTYPALPSGGGGVRVSRSLIWPLSTCIKYTTPSRAKVDSNRRRVLRAALFRQGRQFAGWL